MKKKTISFLGISAFCESMAMMLSAGIQTDEALLLLVEENNSEGVLAEALCQACLIVEEGRHVSEALQQTGAFPDYMVRMVSLGEREGQMEDVFSYLAKYYAEQEEIGQKLRSLVRYPAVMLVVIIAVLVVMLAKVLPVFSGVYESMTGSLSASAYNYVYLADVICWIAFIGMAAAAVILLIFQLMWRTEGGNAFVRRFLERLPLTAGIMSCLGMYRFLISLRIALTAGEPQDLAVEESMKLTNCAPVEAKLQECAKLMEEGEGIAQAAYHVGLLEPVYGRMLLAGSRSGSLEQVLDRLGGLMQETLTQRVDRLVDLLEPVLSGIMMLTVGFSLLSVMLPLIGMVSSIG